MNNDQNNSPKYDLEQEVKRWKGFFSVWSDPEPEVGLTPRELCGKKIKLHYGTMPHLKKNIKFLYSLFIL